MMAFETLALEAVLDQRMFDEVERLSSRGYTPQFHMGGKWYITSRRHGYFALVSALPGSSLVLATDLPQPTHWRWNMDHEPVEIKNMGPPMIGRPNESASG